MTYCLTVAGEYVAVFGRLTEALNESDADAALRLMAEDVELIPLRAPTEGPYYGHDGVRAFVADNAEIFDSFRVDYHDVRDLGDRLLVVGTIHIRGKASGIETDVASAGVATFRDGKLVRWEDFGDRGRAFKAAGVVPG